MDEKIDFVITWVDGNDENWKQEKVKYADIDGREDKRDVRYRDWDILKYWFRAIEKNAKWVNKLFFVTCGQKPEWLNEKYEKIVLVNHEDFIDKKYLPTFNSCVIEANLHRIKGLSDKFVYFNDDMFLNKEVYPEDFFVHGKPKDNLIFTPVNPSTDIADGIHYNSMKVINRNFEFGNIDRKKMFSLKNGKYLYKNISLSIYGFNVGMRFNHLPTSFLKSTFEEVWIREGELLNKICANKFRTHCDVSQWLFQFWQMASNNYELRKVSDGKYFDIKRDNKNIFNEIKNHKYKLICINDNEKIEEFEEVKARLVRVFEKRYSHKSEFEI